MMINNVITYIVIIQDRKKDIDCVVTDTAIQTTKVRLHTRPVCHLALFREALAVICVKESLTLFRGVPPVNL